MKNIFVLFISGISFAGCAHRMNHGTVAMQESDTIAHVSIHDVRPGDKVTLFKSVCRGSGPVRETPCEREELATGYVKKVFNEHFSSVEFPEGTAVSVGQFVEATNK